MSSQDVPAFIMLRVLQCMHSRGEISAQEVANAIKLLPKDNCIGWEQEAMYMCFNTPWKSGDIALDCECEGDCACEAYVDSMYADEELYPTDVLSEETDVSEDDDNVLARIDFSEDINLDDLYYEE